MIAVLGFAVAYGLLVLFCPLVFAGFAGGGFWFAFGLLCFGLIVFVLVWFRCLCMWFVVCGVCAFRFTMFGDLFVWMLGGCLGGLAFVVLLALICCLLVSFEREPSYWKCVFRVLVCFGILFYVWF